MKTHEILFQTLSQADDYVNGEQLAQELGVSLYLYLEGHPTSRKRWGRHRIPKKRRATNWSQAIFCFLK